MLGGRETLGLNTTCTLDLFGVLNVRHGELLRVADTRVEFSVNPLGIDEPRPRFSWTPIHSERGQLQKAYRIIVSSSYENALNGVGDVWDSGVVESDSNIVEYSGAPLKSFTRYFWRVKWWDYFGRESSWSDVAWFETAVLDPGEWKGVWIGGGQLLRKEFYVDGDVAEARVYIAGLGYYELRINGMKIGDKALDPLWSEYNKRIYYSVYEATDAVKKGANAVAVMLGRGRYSQRFERGFLRVKYYDEPKLIFILRVKLTNGRTIELYSDETWRCVDKGPIMSDDIYNGFRYDARLEPLGWDKPGFDDSSWRQCSRVDLPKGVLVSSTTIPTTKIMAVIKPREVYSPNPNVYVFDFGQNITGWVRLRARGSSGAVVNIRYSEVINSDGTLNTKNLGAAEATDAFILRGNGVEVLEPKFTYHGFRYAEVSGSIAPPSLDDIEAVVVHAELEPRGSFVCSNKLLNDIHRLVLWSLKGNLTNGVQTDCPQRAERMGWLGDAWLSSDAAVLNFNMVRYYEKIVSDIIDSQREDGSIPDVVPPYWELYPADPAWGTAFIYIPWVLYLYYGDRRVLERVFEYAKKWWDYLYSRTKDGILYFGKYGDWVPPGRVKNTQDCPSEIISTWILYRDAKLLMRMAKVLGRVDDILYFESRVREIGEAFNRVFLHERDVLGRKVLGYYSIYTSAGGTEVYLGSPEFGGSQTCLALPLAEDLVPKEKVGDILGALVHSIEVDWDSHFNVGILGMKYVPEVLARYGYTELAYRALTQETYPGFGYMIREGATTLWERWERLAGSGMNSHNHHMFGSIDAWLYRRVAGIEVVEPGFKRFAVKPPVVGGLTHASAYLYTVRGLVAVHWSRSERMFKLDVAVPVGSTAEVHLPKMGKDIEVLEGGRAVWKAGGLTKVEGVLSAREEDGRIVIEIGSGSYSFEVKVVE
ncbi:MAG: family 78 glycoside hydrolase catalytic domain [Ignisphaera sp.]|nr:glycoside hydrolase family 78 protein [Ignisphaera sp.]MDW8084856.1 family 78 glycoside hydrolase catalytic domain [Ignisphaera sp.]